MSETSSHDDDLAPGDERPPEEPAAGENICPVCGGEGSIDAQRCETCGGSGGRGSKTKSLAVAFCT